MLNIRGRKSIIKIINKIKLFKSESGSISYEIRRKFLRGKLPRVLLNRTNTKYIGHTARRINRIMLGKNYRYLEIGVADGTTLQAISSQKKHGVDPFPLFNTTRLPNSITFDSMTSDTYFASTTNDEKFDFIFLDGLHESNQLFKDFINSLKRIKVSGWILIDDIIPNDSISAISNIDESYKIRGVKSNEGYPWHGDCYKLLPTILNNFPQIESFLIFYPDNPQLLLRVKEEISLSEISILEGKKFNTTEDYFEVFAAKKLNSYPLYIEEILINDLVFRGIINK